MEEHKLLALHQSLSKLRKFGGLGVSSQYSWQKKEGGDTNVFTTKDGKTVRKDGLPVNELYNNFVKEGSYDRTKVNDGDGRVIKRDFSDCAALISDNGNTTSDDDSLDSEIPREKKQQRKEKRKEEKKAAKKAAKLEAKRQAKLEEKKRLKKEAKRKKLELETKAEDVEGEERPKKKMKNSSHKEESAVSKKTEKMTKKEKKEKKSKKSKKEKR